jgi:pimeloyl-ACP methyl ester carboxylesterase
MAFTRTLRGVVDTRGQLVTALDRSYHVRVIPTLTVWSTKDPINPADHAQVAHACLPGCQLELLSSGRYGTGVQPPDRGALNDRRGMPVPGPGGD